MDTMSLADLPPITDYKSIMPGSIAKPLQDMDYQWVLNSRFEWVLTREGTLLHEPNPEDPIPAEGAEYVRIIYPGDPPVGAWVPTHFAEQEDYDALEEEMRELFLQVYDTYAGTVAKYKIQNAPEIGNIFNNSITVPRTQTEFLIRNNADADTDPSTSQEVIVPSIN